MPIPRYRSIASALGKWLSIDIRVRPASIGSIVTRPSLRGKSSFGVPSSWANPSTKTSRRGGSASTMSQKPRGWSPVGPVMWYSTWLPGARSWAVKVAG